MVVNKTEKAIKLMINLKKKYNMDLQNLRWKLNTGRLSTNLAWDIMKKINAHDIGEAQELISNNYKTAESYSKEKESDLQRKGWIYKRVPLAKHKKELNQIKKED